MSADIPRWEENFNLFLPHSREILTGAMLLPTRSVQNSMNDSDNCSEQPAELHTQDKHGILGFEENVSEESRDQHGNGPFETGNGCPESQIRDPANNSFGGLSTENNSPALIPPDKDCNNNFTTSKDLCAEKTKAGPPEKATQPTAPEESATTISKKLSDAIEVLISVLKQVKILETRSKAEIISLHSKQMGYKFIPTDEEILRYVILRNTVPKERLNCIQDLDSKIFYSSFPAQLQEHLQMDEKAVDGNISLLFSTELNKENNRTTWAVTAGEKRGSWKETGAMKHLQIDEGKGGKRGYYFEEKLKKGEAGKKLGWKLTLFSKENGKHVICRLEEQNVARNKRQSDSGQEGREGDCNKKGKGSGGAGSGDGGEGAGRGPIGGGSEGGVSGPEAAAGERATGGEVEHGEPTVEGDEREEVPEEADMEAGKDGRRREESVSEHTHGRGEQQKEAKDSEGTVVSGRKRPIDRGQGKRVTDGKKGGEGSCGEGCRGTGSGDGGEGAGRGCLGGGSEGGVRGLEGAAGEKTSGGEADHGESAVEGDEREEVPGEADMEAGKDGQKMREESVSKHSHGRGAHPKVRFRLTRVIEAQNELIELSSLFIISEQMKQRCEYERNVQLSNGRKEDGGERVREVAEWQSTTSGLWSSMNGVSKVMGRVTKKLKELRRKGLEQERGPTQSRHANSIRKRPIMDFSLTSSADAASHENWQWIFVPRD